MRAARIVLVIAVAGALVRFVNRGPDPPGGVAFHQTAGLDRPSRDSVSTEARTVSRPLRRGERIDPNRASVTQLVRLPKIGPALAARIVRFRDSVGGMAFQSLEDLERVPGIGAVVAQAVAPHVTVAPGGPPRSAGEGAGRISLNTAGLRDLAALPGIGPVRARAILDDRQRRGPFKNIADLGRVRGIGPATIERLRARVRVP